MKSFFTFVLILFISISFSNTYAQNITISSTDLVDLKNNLTKFQDSISTLNNVISEKENEINKQLNSYKKLSSTKDSIQNINLEINNDNTKKSKVIDSLGQELKRINDTLKTLRKSSDLSLAKLANSRLYYTFNQELISQSINNINNIKTEQVKKDFKQLLPLLTKYQYYSNDVKEMLKKLQAIDSELRKSKHRSEEYKKQCRSILNNSSYYKEQYLKKGQKWTIPYLDIIIDATKAIIERHNPAEGEISNFRPLIGMLEQD